MASTSLTLEAITTLFEKHSDARATEFLPSFGQLDSKLDQLGLTVEDHGANTNILAKILARRLESVLPTVKSDDQTGFVKGRHSFFNIRCLLDVLYSASEDAPECAVSIDAENAFDRVEWVYLWAVLERFGFGPNFISWVKLLHSAPMAL